MVWPCCLQLLSPRTCLGVTLLICGSLAWAGIDNPASVELESAACQERRVELPADADGHYQLTLAPDRTYLAWLEEEGADVAVSSDGGASWVDSAPWRWADEPLLLTSDISGVVGFDIRGMRQGRPHVFGLRLQCQAGTSEREQQFWSDARQLSALRTSLDEKWHFLDGIRALLLGMRALHLYAATDDQRAWVQFQLAALVRQRGLLREAADLYQQAATSSEKAQRPKWYSSALYRRGQALYAGGAADVGDLFLESARISKEQGQDYQAASAKQDYCLILRANGEVAAAVECLEDRVDEIRRLNEPADECIVLRNLATAYLFQGRYAAARKALDSSAQLAESLDDPREMAGALLLQSHLDTWAGNFDRALQRLQKARTLRVESGGPLETARVDSRIANVLLQAGRTVLARSFLEQASRSFEIYGARGWLGESYMAISHSYSLERNPEIALQYAQRAADVLADTGTITQRSDALIELARDQLATGQDTRATETLNVIRELQPDPPWSDVVDIAIISRTLKRRTGGLPLDRELLQLVDGALERGQIVQYLDLASLMAQLDGADVPEAEVRKRVTHAMRIGRELARKVGSPSLRASLLRRLQPLALRDIFQLPDGQELSTEAVLGLVQPSEELRAIDRQASRSPVDSDSLSELERVLSDELLNRQVQVVGAERRKLLVEFMQSGGVDPVVNVARTDLRAVSLANTAFYYFVSDNDRAGYLLWNGQSWTWHSIHDPGGFRQAVQALSETLQGGYSSRSRIEELAARVSAQVGLANWEGSKPETVYVLAEPEVLSIPWPLLPLGLSKSPLADNANVIELQSLSPGVTPPVQDVWLLGANPPDGSGLASLPALTAELGEIRKRWSGRPVHSYFNADLDELLDALSAPGALVHVASHGLGDTGRAEESGLWLRGQNKDLPALVSSLRLRELDARAAVVVLSACESGKSTAGLSLGAGGVAGSLVDAGVSTVVGNRWDVSDRTASQFAMAFHGALAQSGTDSVVAMRQAVSRLRSDPSTAHPRHWAGWFILESGPHAGAYAHSVGR